MSNPAEVFYAEMDSVVLPAMGRLVAALDDAAQTTLGIRAVMTQAELDVAAIFKERDAGGAGKGRQNHATPWICERRLK